MHSIRKGAQVSPAAADRPLFRQTVSANAAGARAARDALRPLLETLAINAAMRDALLLAVAELVINPGEHARPPASEVEVTLVHDDGRLRLELRDDGAPFEGFDSRWQAGPVDPLAESGRGLALVAAQFPDARYSPCQAGHNLLSLDAGPAPVPKFRVLLVDDDAPTLRVLGHYLEDDYDVVACESAEAALEALDTQSVDLVISDIRMPGLDGIELRRELASQAATDTLPFLFLTGQAENETRLEGLAVDDYLVKPVGADQLRRVARRVLARARQLRGRLDEQHGARLTSRLRPSLPGRLGGFRCIVRTVSAGPGGGDLLLGAPTSAGHLVVLADLMGHGAAAKLHAHALAGYLNGLLAAPDASWSPASLLQAISEAFQKDALLGETLATLVIAGLADDGRVTLASAGHPSPWHIAGGVSESIDAIGPLPGLVDEGGYAETRLVLARGDRLVLYTDGLVELHGDADAEAALVANLTGALVTTEGSDLDTAAEATWQVWRDRVGEAPADDATLVLLERT
jgi:CheY-like chemotaxis protein/anti-sigma regulatory factor (Ser/Thr protein kinase)